MARYETIPEAVEAVQWFKPGDHPDVVACGGKFRVKHELGAVVVPGEWVVRFDDGILTYSAEEFARTFRPVDAEAEDDDAVTLRSEVDAVLRQLDELATIWGDEGVFRRCRDRLRTALKIGREE